MFTQIPMRVTTSFIPAAIAGLGLLTTPLTIPQSAQAQALNVYKIDVESIYVERDQRTRTINFEGLLELRGTFSANNVAAPEYPTNSSFISLDQGGTANLNYNIATITSSSSLPLTVPIKAELLELEPGGGQGGTDRGSLTDNIVLDGSPVVTKTLRLTTSADNWKERSATVVVTFKATKQ